MTFAAKKKMTEQHALNWDATNVTQTAVTTPPTDDGSLALIQRCLHGDDNAYVELYNLHAGMIYRLAYSLLQHQEDAEEVLQDSFEYAFRKLKNYNHKKSAFKTWLYRIAVSRSRNKRRRKWLPTSPLDGPIHIDIPDKNNPTPDAALALSEQQQTVWQALGELSPKLREVAILRYYQGLRYAEIGEILDIPPKTAESRMRLAHKALREHLAAALSEY